MVVWPTVADPSSGLTRADTGRLLDECGSDYKPLVTLLLDIGASVRPVLNGMSPQTVAQWQNARAPLVHKLVSTRYLQTDVARWAVDVWAQALGIAPAPEPPRLETATTESATTESSERRTTQYGASSTSRANAAAAPRGAAPVRPAIVSPQQVPAALRQTPSWAGGPVSFRVGQQPKSATLSALANGGRVVVRGTVAPGPRFQPAERRAAMILGLLLVLITFGLLNSFARRPDVTTPVDASETELSSLRTPSAAADAGLVAAVPDSVPSNSIAPAATKAYAEPYSDPHDEMVRAPELVDASTRLLALQGQLREAGVGGRYLVAQRVRDVSGSASCDAVAGALAGGRESEEVVSHVPGTDRFMLVTRGVSGTLDSEGQFISQPRTGTTNNVNWQFLMRGRFGPDGFTGESITHTDAILRWGKLQTCVVTAELSGRRLPD